MQTASMSFSERYGIAVLAAAVSVGLRLLLNPLFGTDIPFITLFPAVAFSAYYAGFRSGLATAIIGALALDFAVMHPVFEFGVGQFPQNIQVLLFIFMGGFIAWVAAERRRVQAKLKLIESESGRRSREAEEALRESEERSRLAQQSVGVGVWEWELATGEVEWSEGVHEILGLEAQKDKTVLEDWVDFIVPEDRDRAEENIRRLIAGGARDFYDEFRVRRHSDGGVRWLAAKGKIVRENGRPSRLIGVNIDITESKETEFRIQELNDELKKLNSELFRRVRELQTVIDITPVGIAVAQDASCEVIMANSAFAEMVGLLHGHSISLDENPLSFRHLKSGRELAAQELPMRRAIAERKAVLNEEIEIERADGSVITVFGYAAPVFDDEGQVISCVAAQIDITERKHSEIERERKLDAEQALRLHAEEANRLKDEFLATVSHELRTPLNSIIGWVAVMRDKTLTEEFTTRAVDAIERGARAQSQLIEDLLDVSRIISGKLQLSVTPVEVISVINHALETLRPAAVAKNIELCVNFGTGILPVSGDHDRLQQVAWNLLSNAIKFTPQGGRAEIRVEQIGGDVQISVSDTGRGIRSDFLPFVFDRFRQADGSITRKFSGLGLGLAIVRHLVELHGGEVAVESVGEDKGSTFTVRLPALIATESDGLGSPHRSERPHKEFPILSGLRVLIVDDEEDGREVLKLTFERFHALVEEASSADEALAKVKEWRPQIIVSDIGMPARDGYQFIEDVRAWERSTSQEGTPAIALTAYARDEDRDRAINAGYQMHIPKPVEPLRIAELVQGLCGPNDKVFEIPGIDNAANVV
jgi:PAS domain S-box-containing protein